MHMFDGQEDNRNNKPWKMCIENCLCQGQFIHGRISTMVIYKGLRERSDRIAVPLPFGDRDGILLHPAHSQVNCLYGIDGATYNLNNPRHPGCSDRLCDPDNVIDQNGHVWCGFSGAPAMAWPPQNMKGLLENHFTYGARYHTPGFHSGYNELIFDSTAHNENLPRSIEAFFTLKGSDHLTGLGYGILINIVEAHAAYLSETGLSNEDVPLVEFDPHDWHSPFHPFESL
jgi:hypothetical protein